MTTKYHVQISNVREVSLTGSVDLEFWRDRLAPEGLFPMVRNGRATLLIVGASAKFMGLPFRELSISVAVCRTAGGSDWDGVFLVQAFNSRRFFAFVERQLFHTPYQHADVQIDVGPPAKSEITQAGQKLLSMEMAALDTPDSRPPQKDSEGGFEGPIFLPSVPGSKPNQRRLFYGRLSGQTQTYSVLPTDTIQLRPNSNFPVIQGMIDSHFQAEEWIIRANAVHGKSKTLFRPVSNWGTN